MKRILNFLLLVFLSIVFSCEREYHSSMVDCDYCFSERPDSDNIVIYLTINSDFSKIPVTVYKGKIEDNHIVAYDTLTEAKSYIFLKIDEDYTLTALYKIKDKSVLVVDEDKFKARLSSCESKSSCWALIGGYYDVQLNDKFAKQLKE